MTGVGYSKYPLRNGATLAGASFNVIAQKKTTLTQIVPGGYENSTGYTGGKKSGCKGAIIVQFLDQNGKIETDKEGLEKEYKWYHTWDSKTGWKDDACWKRGNTVITTENDVEIDQGQGLWIVVSTGWIDGMNFMNAGEALLDAQTVPLNNGATLVVAPLSKGIKLNELVPGGYENSTGYTGGKKSGCKGAIIVQFLDQNGKIDTDGEGLEKEYKWYHTWDSKTGWKDDACWKRGNTVITAENAPEIKMGEGVWIVVSTGWIEGMFVGAPGIDD